MRSKVVLFGMLALAVSTCGDGPTTPPGLPDITVVDESQWSGSLVTLRAEAFRSGGSAQVVVESDTIETESGMNPDERRFRLPALLTGRYEATVLTNAGAVPISLDVVGLARDPVPVAGGFFSVIVENVQPTGGGEAYLAEPFGSFFGPDEEGAYAVVNVFNPEKARQLPALVADGTNEIKMTVPGPSYRTNHLVFDFSPEGATDARVWRVFPTLESVEPLSCGWERPEGFHYTAVDMSPGICLEIRRDEVWRDGIASVISDDAFEYAQFRIGPGGEHTVLLTRQGVFEDEAMSVWPVFDAEGRIAYESARYEHVPGAAFAADGSILWIVARDREGSWALHELETSTGELRRSLAFPDELALLDVLRNPVDGQLYVASAGDLLLPTLHIVDSQSLELLASIPAPSVELYPHNQIRFGGVLEMGGSDGRVHLLGRAGIDAGWWVWSFDRGPLP